MKAGILSPIFSLPVPGGRGDFSVVKDYLNFLHRSGLSYWQILPINPVDAYGSPYASFSLSAGDLGLLDLTALAEDGLLARADVVAAEEKEDYLFEYLDFERAAREPGYAVFLQEEGTWAKDVAVFRALRRQYGVLMNWPDRYRIYDVNTVAPLWNESAVQKYAVLEYLFDRQWYALRNHARGLGITIVGDLPYYPGRDSLELWRMPENFLLDENRNPLYISGVPGDDFNDAGQTWNSPVYDWERLRADDFRFHTALFRRALKRYDLVRLDHFRGYEKIFHIPYGETPKEGHWAPVPGRELLSRFLSMRDRFLIEDLGTLDRAFYEFRDAFGFRGMGVLPFEAPGTISAYPRIYYTGNHDTAPLGGYVSEMGAFERRGWEDYLKKPISRENLLQYALERPEEIVIFQHTDLWDDAPRINVPGTETGNWRAQIPVRYMDEKTAEYIRQRIGERADNNGY